MAADEPVLGAHWDGRGVRFGVRSAHATSVTLELIDAPPGAPARVPLAREAEDRWSVYMPGLSPGARYGFRADGAWDPARGHRFNAAKLLLDPRALAIDGALTWDDAVFGHRIASPEEPDSRDSAPFVPKAVVVDPHFDWGDDRPPRTPWRDTLIYECHVKGMTARHPELPAALRGTYLGLAAEPVIAHLRALGVTALQLLPVQHSVSERELVRRGLTNYWGYNPLGWFAPDARFASGSRGAQVRELQTLVRTLHRAGIEVLLDVVFGHTAEGYADGPTLSLRGLDNAAHYVLDPADPRRALDFTGCGATANFGAPAMRELLRDCLRHWVRVFHVDGFRFDLAPALARGLEGEHALTALFSELRDDPALAGVKWIAEPWDLGPHGYRLGDFPAGFAEWNDQFRDAARRFWRGDPKQVGPFASRLSGSADLFAARSGRSPLASISFVACHDGFTLRDLVSYARKRNDANGHENADGVAESFSNDCGLEGETRAADVRRARNVRMRSLLASVAVAQGVPMLGHGDELGRTQRGNNNAYCHDSPLSWIDWRRDEEARELLAFAREVFALRRAHPALRRERFPAPGDVAWLRPDGAEMRPADWEDPERRWLAMHLPRGESGAEDLLVLVNASARTVRFRLPRLRHASWHARLASSLEPPALGPREADLAPGALLVLTANRSY